VEVDLRHGVAPWLLYHIQKAPLTGADPICGYTPARMNYRSLLQNVERTIASIDRSPDVATTILEVCEAVVRNFRNQLGIYGGRLYVRRDHEYILTRGFGRSRQVRTGLAVSADYPPVRRALSDGIDLTDLSDPTVDQVLEGHLGVKRFAAVPVGDEGYLLSFDVSPNVPASDLLLALGIVRTAVDSKIRTEKLEGLIHEAHRIQQSILPHSVPAIGDYDVAAISRPAELVGGDFYDFIATGNESFGAAIADASGHGLLAALLVRDVYVGLRMAIGSDLKISRTLERLNRILNKSRLTTKFVSLFYAEFESNGEILYVNAGHPAPLHFVSRKDVFRELAPTGMVLGPSANATYGRRGFRMEPGDLVCLYTDGITEAHDAKGREFGTGRLRRLLVEMKQRPAKEIVERVLLTTGLFSGEPAPEDDQTVVVIRRKLAEPKVRRQPPGIKRPATPAPGTMPPSGGAPPAGSPTQ
jgi:sigma-B regulation protein RsbU (phosphoserine phosphatase)